MTSSPTKPGQRATSAEQRAEAAGQRAERIEERAREDRATLERQRSLSNHSPFPQEYSASLRHAGASPPLPNTDCDVPMNKPSTVQVSLKLPFVELTGTWAPDEAERNAAWEMYVELITRVAVVELAPQEGSLREALNALYSLFPSTRKILRRYGPAVAQPSRGSELSFGAIAIAVLNQGLRPMLTRWHPELAAYEATRPPSVSPIEHERAWPENQQLRAQLDALRQRLREYALALSQAARVPELTPTP